MKNIFQLGPNLIFIEVANYQWLFMTDMAINKFLYLWKQREIILNQKGCIICKSLGEIFDHAIKIKIINYPNDCQAEPYNLKTVNDAPANLPLTDAILSRWSQKIIIVPRG